tara:strand:+ start:123 stop:1100 length:978 start_codon:yes stop_codon:yes gene_type:complete
MKTKAICINKTGGPEVLTLKKVNIKKLEPNEVLIKHEAIGLNFIDIYHRTGVNSLPLPFIPGLEGSGVIEEIGSCVKEFNKGDRVAYCTGPVGSYCQHRSFPADKLVPLPDDVDFQDAAAMLLKGFTAEYLIHRAYKVRPGEEVLLHAAAGGVGTILCQWLKKLGAIVIGTVGSPEKAAYAMEHGCDFTILYREEDVVSRVLELTDGQGVSVVYDSVGKETFNISLNCIARRGYFISFGNSSGLVAPFLPMLLAEKGSLFFSRPSLMDYCSTQNELLKASESLFNFFRNGLKINIDSRLPLEEVKKAHEVLENRLTKGSTILLPY